MAHPNINERRQYVNQLLMDKVDEKQIKDICSELFGCTRNAITFDIVTYKNRRSSDKRPIMAGKSFKKKIYERDGKVCQYCGTTTTENFVTEHIVSYTIGGRADFDNIVIACQSCNINKRSQIWIPANFDSIASGSHYEKVIKKATRDCR